MGFKLLFGDARVWRYSFTAIGDLVDLGAFKVSDKGFEIRAMDPSHVALVEFRVPREGFEVFDLEEEASVPINIEAVMKILRRAGKRDELGIELEGQRLGILLASKELERRFYLTTLQGSVVEEAPELKIDLPSRSRMYPQAFYSSYNVLSEVGEAVTLISGREGLRMLASSELAEAEVIMEGDAGGLLEHVLADEGEEKASYTLDYLDKVAKASSVAEEVVLEFGTDKPCRVELALPRGARLVLYVAPRSE